MNQSNKNILITFLYKEGAGPIFTLEMARGLAQNGCNVYAIVSSKISNRKDWEDCEFLREVYFLETGTRKSALIATVCFFFLDRFKITKHFEKIHFDFLISTFYHPWATALLNCFEGTKIVLCHDPIHHSGVGKIEQLLTTRYIKSADKVVVLTKSFIPLVHDEFGFNMDNIVYMPHGRMSLYRVGLSISKSSYKDQNIHFLFFGRIEKYKGLNILADAYRKVIQQYSGISLTVAGSGNFEDYRMLFSDLPHVSIDNRYIADEEISSYFNRPNTVVVLPYIDASQSGVIPIALEYHTPVIATDTGGLKEQLDEGHLGIFCRPNEVESLVNAMVTCIENPAMLVEQADLMDVFKESLNWERVTKRIFL